jgi:tetratricopeptide (TPR) repeat protein
MAMLRRIVDPRSASCLAAIALTVGFIAVQLTLMGCGRSNDAAAQHGDAPVEALGEPLGEVTFNRDIAPIVFERCAGCHHPGEAAPFSLLSYDDVRRRAGQIADVTASRFMPPWLPSEGAGEFVGSRHLTDRQLAQFRAWADTGCLRGGEVAPPTPPKFVEGWQLGPPDLVLESPAYALAAEGSDVFRNFVILPKLDGPRWIAAIELRPENPRVTHHARLGVDSSNESLRRDAADPEPGYAGMAWGQDPDGQLVTWAPGMVAHAAASDSAWRLQPNACLVLHTHMQPSGKKESVRFRVGIHFAKEPPREFPVMLRIGSRDIDIPAGKAEHVVDDEFTLPIDVRLRLIFPHAHSLCQKVFVEAALPNGERKPLLKIDKFDENWHDTYYYVEPVLLPRGAKLHTRFAYDNSAANVRNRHHPPQRTGYGSNVDDEMADVYLQAAAVHADQRAVLTEYVAQQEIRSQIVGFRKTLAIHPDDRFTQEGLAACYFGAGKPRDAIAVLEARLKNPVDAVFPLVSLGMAQLAVGEVPHAEEHFRKALALDANYPLAWQGLGKALVALKKTDEAQAAFRRAIELAPGMLDASLALAELLAGRKQLDAAINVCEAAANSSPDNPQVQLKIAEYLVKEKKFDESFQHLQIAQRLAPYIHPPKVLLAVYCFQNGEGTRALRLLEEAHREAPRHPVPAFFLGQLARRAGNNEAARKYLADAASAEAPANWPASHRQRFAVLLHGERARLAEDLQDEAMARDALSHWLEADPENKQVRAMLESLRGGGN